LEKKRLEKEKLEKEQLEKERFDRESTTYAGRMLQDHAKDHSIREEMATKSLAKPKTLDEGILLVLCWKAQFNP
jgi:hypothetical protein